MTFSKSFSEYTSLVFDTFYLNLQPCRTSEAVETQAVGSLVMSGSMCCRAYFHPKATVGEAIQVNCQSFFSQTNENKRN